MAGEQPRSIQALIHERLRFAGTIEGRQERYHWLRAPGGKSQDEASGNRSTINWGASFRRNIFQSQNRLISRVEVINNELVNRSAEFHALFETSRNHLHAARRRVRKGQPAGEDMDTLTTQVRGLTALYYQIPGLMREPTDEERRNDISTVLPVIIANRQKNTISVISEGFTHTSRLPGGVPGSILDHFLRFPNQGITTNRLLVAQRSADSSSRLLNGVAPLRKRLEQGLDSGTVIEMYKIDNTFKYIFHAGRIEIIDEDGTVTVTDYPDAMKQALEK